MIDYIQANKPVYHVGDWVEHKESKEQATIRRIMSYGAIEIEFAYSTESDIYQANDFHNDFRKLDPSEVVIRIGCMSGTVSFADADRFILRGIGNSEMANACIMFKMLDAATCELVESLLKAQDEEK